MSARTRKPRRKVPGGCRSWADHAELSDGCLRMVRTALERLGEDMSKTPPMFYDDAIMCAVFRRRKQMVDALVAAERFIKQGGRKFHVLVAIKAALAIAECKP